MDRWRLLVVSFFLSACNGSSVTADGPATPPETGAPDSAVDKAVLETGPAGDGSLTDKAAFIGTRSLDACSGIHTACKGQVAGCLLDAQTYLEGTFPGERKVLVTAQAGQTINVLLYLEQKLSPGTQTEVRWYEPGCVDEKSYQLSGDLFQKAGPSNIFSVEELVSETGDHLVSVWSDSVCSFLMRIDVR